jgi:hypothetical protein
MLNNGCRILNNSISNGIKNVKFKVEEDSDYGIIINDIEKAVFI